MADKNELWQKCAAFHGHVCPGLTIGFRAALYAIDLLELTFSEDEKTVCVSENDACGCDAIQVVLGCSVPAQREPPPGRCGESPFPHDGKASVFVL